MLPEDEVADLVDAIQKGIFHSVKEYLRSTTPALISPHHSGAHSNAGNILASNKSSSSPLHPNVQPDNVGANLRDSDGCSLLHWAAINNRYSIANLLIDSGAHVGVTGGILNETPVMWAVRKKYYHMVDLLIRKGGKEMLAHKNKNGIDALMLAHSLADYNMVFLLLYGGADPNAIVSTEGHTRLQSLCKQENGPSHLNIEYVRWLLRFGADPSITDVHGNNCLHTLAFNTTGMINSYIVHDIYTQNASNRTGVWMAGAKNNNGHTPYQVSKANFNAKMTNMLFDEMLFHAFPYHTPTVLAMGVFLSLYFGVNRFGLLIGMLIAVALYATIFQVFVQWSIIVHRRRVPLGFLMGGMCVAGYAFATHIQPQGVSFIATVIVYVCLALSGYHAWMFHTRRPAPVKQSQRSALVAQILESSPKEGTYEEHAAAMEVSDTIEELGPAATICSVCVCEEYKNASHCKQCGYCILDRNQHIEYLGTCTGRGNMRTLLLFLFFSSVGSLTYIFVSYWVHSNKLCSMERGLLWNFFAVEWCLISQHPQLFGAFWGVCACIPCFMAGFSQQFMLIAWETTLPNVMTGNFMYAQRPITLTKAFGNVFGLLMTNVHKIVTPDLLADDEELVGLNNASTMYTYANTYSTTNNSLNNSLSSGNLNTQMDSASINSPSSAQQPPQTAGKIVGGRSLDNSTRKKASNNNSNSNNSSTREEINWADEDEVKPQYNKRKQQQQLQSQQRSFTSPYSSPMGGHSHTHSHDGRCCSHDHGSDNRGEYDATAPLRAMNIDIDERV